MADIGKSSKLVLHAGAYAATEEQVFDAATPSGTSTWQPVPHSTLLQTVERHVHANGWRIDDRGYALAKDGDRMFGVWALTGNGMSDHEYQLALGIRNSHDKMFPAGLAVGSRVFVCDNLAFSSEITVVRRHTVHIMRDLDRLVATAIGRVGEHRVQQDVRIRAYQTTLLDNVQAHDLLIRSVDARVISNRVLPDVLQQWRTPTYEEFAERNAWSLFNAFTSVLKEANPLELTARTTRLHGLMDGVSGVILRNMEN